MSKKTRKFSGLDLSNKGIRNRIPYIRIYYTSLIINLILIVIVFFLQDRLPPEIPLYYGLPEGTGQIARSSMIFLPSLTAIGFIFINTLIIFILSSDFLKKSLVITSLVLSIFAFTTTAKIMLLVGNF